MKRILPWFFALMMLVGAVAHWVMPAFYAPMVPDFISVNVANTLAALGEFTVGILLVLPRYRAWGAMAFMILMIAFFPIHIWDMLKENPAIGPPPFPLIRLALQLVLIYAGWWLFKKYK